jgi:hypothetical protein
MITLHPAVKTTADGFIPMITIRGAKGQMRGSVTPQGDAREFRTFTNALAAEVEARVIALRCALQYPNALRVSI